MSVALRQFKIPFLLVVIFLLTAALNGCRSTATPVGTAAPTRIQESKPVPTDTEIAPAEATDTPLFPADTSTAAPPTEPPTVTPSATSTIEAVLPTPSPEPTQERDASPGPEEAAQTQQAAQNAYPGPEEAALTQQALAQNAYPGPEDAALTQQALAQDPYPEPGDPTTTPLPTSDEPYPLPGQTPAPTPTRPSNTPTATATGGSPATPPPSGTETPQATPTERISEPLGTPPAGAGTVTIWHSWEGQRLDMLMLLIEHFQDSFPDVRFDITFAPADDLLYRYEALSYLGGGPSLLIGPSDWTAYLVDRQLVEDLTPYTSQAFLKTINPAAVDTGRYQGQLASLPIGVSGSLLYRNRLIIPEPASTLDTLLTNAQAATRAGTVGAYLERGFAFSFAHLYGLGGQLLDEEGQPAFQNQDYRYSLAWIDMMNMFLRPGAASFNTEDDTNTFMQGRAGYIIDGSWNLKRLADAIGADNLVIDAWPVAEGGHLSGYVKAESVYLNINTAGISAEDHIASLRFMGYLMVPQVQAYLAEVDLIPSALTARPRLALHQQAMRSLAGGTAYPAVLLAKDGALRPVYQDALNAALEDIFDDGAAPREALEKALQVINQRLEDMQEAEK